MNFLRSLHLIENEKRIATISTCCLTNFTDVLPLSRSHVCKIAVVNGSMNFQSKVGNASRNGIFKHHPSRHTDILVCARWDTPSVPLIATFHIFLFIGENLLVAFVYVICSAIIARVRDIFIPAEPWCIIVFKIYQASAWGDRSIFKKTFPILISRCFSLFHSLSQCSNLCCMSGIEIFNFDSLFLCQFLNSGFFFIFQFVKHCCLLHWNIFEKFIKYFNIFLDGLKFFLVCRRSL